MTRYQLIRGVNGNGAMGSRGLLIQLKVLSRRRCVGCSVVYKVGENIPNHLQSGSGVKVADKWIGRIEPTSKAFPTTAGLKTITF